MSHSYLLGTALCIVFAVSAGAQTTNKLNNAGVLKMKAAGLDDSTIVKAIESTPGDYDTSVDGLIALKSAGASETILQAILQSGRVKPAPAATPSPAQPIPAPGGYPDELGVYYSQHDTYVALEPEIMSIRTTNVLATAYTYGIKPQKVNGWITGKHSKAKIGSETKTFFLKIPEGTAPTEYTLLRFNEKGDRREVELGRARFTVKMGTEHSAVPFDHEKVEKGKYKVTVNNLKAGDYGFMPPGAEISRNSASAGKVYTFWVIE